MTQRIKLAQDFLPWGVRVADGQIADQSHNHKFGYNAAVGTTPETIWFQGAAYTWPSAAAVLDLTSTDDTADNVAGTGALTVTIEGLDADYAEVSQTITMTGQTAALTTALLRVNRMFVATAGSGLTNAGTVFLSSGAQTTGTPDVATTIRATIGIGLSQTQQCIYTVPAGKKAFIMSIIYTAMDQTNNAVFDLLVRPTGGAWLNKGRVSVFKGTHLYQPQVPQAFAAGTDIEVQGDAGAATVACSAELDILLVDA